MVGEMTFNDLRFPGMATRGLLPQTPPLVRSTFHVPRTNGNVVITLGLGERAIVVPYLLFSANWETYQAVEKFLRDLDAEKARGRQGTVRIPVGDGETISFERCYFDGYYQDPEVGILPDVCGTVVQPGTYFTDGYAVFIQAQAVR